jgi:cytochrome c2
MRGIVRRLAALTLGAALAAALASGAAAADATGDATRGERVFAGKGCARCHAGGRQPPLAPPLDVLRRPQGAWQLAGRVWNHAPGMFTLLAQEGTAWPAIDAGEMADIMAYLGADPARDPAPDVLKGQLTLISKGCLKCHSFRREGGRIGPDLAEPRPEYASASAWAAAMWMHTPRMAATALQQGVLFPRFSADELGNLVGFLRSGRGAP